MYDFSRVIRSTNPLLQAESFVPLNFFSFSFCFFVVRLFQFSPLFAFVFFFFFLKGIKESMEYFLLTVKKNNLFRRSK